MVLEPIYLDLSSSDDEDDDHRGGSTALMYLSKVFHMDADDDDVIIIDKPTSNANVRRDRGRVIRSALDDDECCILDTDPGADVTPDIVSSLDTDELVMTGEKGPVAIRDFPHARYLCVHFPFKSTLHSKFCAQCHCYVCDSLAPCSFWGEGNNPNDHCHASEEPRWKTLRKVARCVTVPLLATGAADLNGSGIPTGGSRLVQSGLLQHATTTPSATQSPVGIPVGSGVSRKLHATVKKDPLVIKLKGKGRGKPSQPPHLGVRSPRPHRILPLSSFPGHRNRPPLPRPTSTPSGRLEDVESAVSIAAQLPQPTSPNPRIRSPHHSSYNPHPPRSTSTPSGRLEDVESAVSIAAQLPQPTSPNPRIRSPHHSSYNPHPPRSTSTPSGRLEDVESAVSIAAQLPQPTSPNPRIRSPHHSSYNPHPPRSTLTPSGRLEEVVSPVRSTAAQSPQPSNPNPVFRRPGATIAAFPPRPRPMASHNPLPGSAGATTIDVLARIIRPPGSEPPQPAFDPNAAHYNPTASPPSHTSPPPPVTNVLRPPGANATVPGAPAMPDRRYVPASALRDQDELSESSMDLTTSPQLQAAVQMIYSSMITDVTQRSSSPVNSAHNASSRRYVPASALRDGDELSEGSMYLTTSPQPQAAVQNHSIIIDADYVAQTFSSLVNSAHNASSREYVPAITLRDEDEFSEGNMDLTIYPQPEAVQKPGMTVDAGYVAQRFSSPVNVASSSHNVDTLAGPIEGWEVHAAVEFDAFAAGIGDGVPSPEQQGPTSLNDVLQQMAGDDYLWEQFPGW